MVAAQSYKGRVMILEENGNPVPAAAAAVYWAPAVPEEHLLRWSIQIRTVHSLSGRDLPVLW
jgi:hypothetical protein